MGSLPNQIANREHGSPFWTVLIKIEFVPPIKFNTHKRNQSINRPSSKPLSIITRLQLIIISTNHYFAEHRVEQRHGKRQHGHDRADTTVNQILSIIWIISVTGKTVANKKLNILTQGSSRNITHNLTSAQPQLGSSNSLSWIGFCSWLGGAACCGAQLTDWCG
jgi:hypothetical protein